MEAKEILKNVNKNIFLSEIMVLSLREKIWCDKIYVSLDGKEWEPQNPNGIEINSPPTKMIKGCYLCQINKADGQCIPGRFEKTKDKYGDTCWVFQRDDSVLVFNHKEKNSQEFDDGQTLSM